MTCIPAFIIYISIHDVVTNLVCFIYFSFNRTKHVLGPVDKKNLFTVETSDSQLVKSYTLYFILINCLPEYSTYMQVRYLLRDHMNNVIVNIGFTTFYSQV